MTDFFAPFPEKVKPLPRLGAKLPVGDPGEYLSVGIRLVEKCEGRECRAVLVWLNGKLQSFYGGSDTYLKYAKSKKMSHSVIGFYDASAKPADIEKDIEAWFESPFSRGKK